MRKFLKLRWETPPVRRKYIEKEIPKFLDQKNNFYPPLKTLFDPKNDLKRYKQCPTWNVLRGG